MQLVPIPTHPNFLSSQESLHRILICYTTIHPLALAGDDQLIPVVCFFCLLYLSPSTALLSSSFKTPKCSSSHSSLDVSDKACGLYSPAHFTMTSGILVLQLVFVSFMLFISPYHAHDGHGPELSLYPNLYEVCNSKNMRCRPNLTLRGCFDVCPSYVDLQITTRSKWTVPCARDKPMTSNGDCAACQFNRNSRLLDFDGSCSKRSLEMFISRSREGFLDNLAQLSRGDCQALDTRGVFFEQVVDELAHVFCRPRPETEESHGTTATPTPSPSSKPSPSPSPSPSPVSCEQKLKECGGIQNAVSCCGSFCNCKGENDIQCLPSCLPMLFSGATSQQFS